VDARFGGIAPVCRARLSFGHVDDPSTASSEKLAGEHQLRKAKARRVRCSRDEYDARLADLIGEGKRSSILAQNEAASASGPRGFVAFGS
jgi:hypothetical protein